MDGNHAGGCSLIGIALTTLLMRLFWMSSPPFSTMTAGKLAKVKLLLVALTVVGLAVGMFYVVQPDKNALADNSERGFEFH